MSETLIEVRCPFMRVRSNGKQTLCAELIVRVKPGSAGNGFCRHCKRGFEFEISGRQASGLGAYPLSTSKGN